VAPLRARVVRLALSLQEVTRAPHRDRLPVVFHHPAHGWCALVAAADGVALLRQDLPEGALVPRTALEMAQELGWQVETPQVLLGLARERPLEEPAHGDAGHHPTPWQHLWLLMRDERSALMTAVVYSAATGLLTLAIPVAVQALVNTLAFTALMQPLLVVGTMLTAGLAFAAVLRALQWLVVEHVQRRMFVRVVVDTSHRLLGDTHAAPSALNRYFDVFLLQKGVATLAVDGTALLLQLVLAALLLGAYHPFLLALDLALVVGAALLVLVTSGGALRSALEESSAKHELGASLQQMTQVPTAEREATREAVLDQAAAWLAARQRHARSVFVQLSMGLGLGVLANAAVLVVGGALVVDGKLTVGQLVAAELVVSALASGLSRMGKYLETYYDVLAGAAKVGHLRDLGSEAGHG
jgi:ABC-type bacteriocin/lantibiotic exporter with double-glycine peptidase domain